MQKLLKPEDRLIVAADFKPGPDQLNDECFMAREWAWREVLSLADKLKGTGIYLKVNSALRALGYSLIGEIKSRGLRVFADLKPFDIGKTLATDGAFLREAKPELLTVSCVAGVAAMRELKAELPDTEVLGVTVLTSLKEADAQAIFGCSIEQAVMRLAQVADEAGIDGLICAPTEARMLRDRFGDRFLLNTPAIRPASIVIKGDDQNPARVMTPKKAIEAGAHRIVVGGPVLQAEDPRDAVMRTLDEIAAAIA